MYKIAICDDDQAYISYLKKLILETNAVDARKLQFYEFYLGEHLYFYEDLNFDLIIMDIRMGKMDGYETAMALRRRNNHSLLVFCSGVYLPEPKYFKANVFRYLLKSDPENELRHEMLAILKEMVGRKQSPAIMCKCTTGKEYIRVSAESILYIEICRGGSRIYLCTGNKESTLKEAVKTRRGLNELAQIFDAAQGFVRIHNSYMVNMAYIKRISQTYVELEEGTILNIARSKIKLFQEIFAQYAAAAYEG